MLFRTLTDREFKKLFGLDLSLFATIAQRVCPVIEQLSIKEGKEKERSSTTAALSPAERLALTLFWLRQYLGDEVIGAIFKLSATTVHNYVQTCLDAFLKVYFEDDPQIAWPDRRHRDMKSVIWRGKRISVLVDVSTQEVLVPGLKLLEQQVYSGKDKCCTRNFQLACAPSDGEIYSLHWSQPGARNDIQNYDVPDNQLHKLLNTDECIGADSIYDFINAKYTHPTIVPWPRNEQASNPAKEGFNKEFSSVRIVIENIFSQMKKWNCCSHIFRHSEETHNRVWRTIAILTQMKMKKRPLRNK
jgi:hypothetical protein